jgi:hypothetical protein
MQDYHSGTAADEEREYRPSAEAEARLTQLKTLEDSKMFEPFQLASAHLNSHLRGRALNAAMAGSPVDLTDYLENAVRHGNLELVAEATKFLDATTSRAGVLGGEPEVVTSAPVWDKVTQVARGTVTVGHHLWRYVDYRDKLPRGSDGLLEEVFNQDDMLEERQCLCLHIGAALLLCQTGCEPSWGDVQAKAAVIREHLWMCACDARAALGDAPPWISQEELDLRINCHDCLYPHHEKDFRVLQFFPHPDLLIFFPKQAVHHNSC